MNISVILPWIYDKSESTTWNDWKLDGLGGLDLWPELCGDLLDLVVLRGLLEEAHRLGDSKNRQTTKNNTQKHSRNKVYDSKNG